MQLSFTAKDICGIFVALPCFSVFLFAPGYVLGLATNVLSFRASSLKVRILLAVPLSVCISPILASLLAHILSVRTSALLFLVFPVLALASFAFERKRLLPQIWSRPRRSTIVGFAIALVWIAICVFTLPDFEMGHRLYSTTAVYDHSVRAALISSAQRTGAPPANPFFYFRGLVRVRYYYYWTVLCALLATITGVGPRGALFGSCIWSGFSLASLIPLYLGEFISDPKRLRWASLIGIALLVVTGLDLFPTAIDIFAFHHPNGDMEWWDANQVTSWIDSLIWTPHHIAGLVACLAGLLLILDAVKTKSASGRAGATVFAALAFASAGGLSVYVTLVFAAFLAIWTMRYLVQGEFKSFAILLIAGAAAGLISLPYLHELLTNAGPPVAAASTARPAGLLTFAVRASHYLSSDTRSWFALPLQLVDMLITYILELGFYFFVGLMVVRFQLSATRRKQLTEMQKACLCLFAISLLLTTFVRSSVIQGNDLGFRGILPAQFVLLLWGALLLQDLWLIRSGQNVFPTSRSDRFVLFTTLLLGALGSTYQIGMLRVFPILRDRGSIRQDDKFGQPNPPYIGSSTYFIRSGYEELNRRISPQAIVQFNPASIAALQMANYHIYQSVDAFAPDCGTPFGGSLQQCTLVQTPLLPIFDRMTNSAQADEVCRQLSIDVLIAQESDPVWRSADSWVWTRQPLVANEYFRAIRCGGATR